MMITSRDIRRAWVASIAQEWRLPVLDFQSGRTPTPHHIQKYFEVSAVGRWVLDEYTPDGMYCEKWRDKPWQSWCGLLLGYTGQRIGDFLGDRRCLDLRLHDGIVDWIIPGTDRLYSANKWSEQSLPPPPNPPIIALKAGDIIATGKGRDGSHLAMVREDKERGSSTIKTFEGNTDGILGDGRRGEGVVKRTRTADEIRETYRIVGPGYFQGSATDQMSRLDNQAG